MRLTLKDDLPFVTVRIVFHGMEAEVPAVLIDTGSAGTILAADVVATIGIIPDLHDTLYAVRGVGGAEVVFARQVDRLMVGENGLDGFDIEVGGMDYGFEINGILGMDFLLRTGANIDLQALELRFP